MDIRELQDYRLSDAVKFNDTLNPKIWDSREHLLPEVREKLLAIAEDFKQFLGIDLEVKDITISGSNAAYTYTPHSDIDLHLVADLPRGDTDEVYRELFNAKKYQYNDEHDYKIGPYDVELYVQNANEPHVSQGIYSVQDNEWKRVPSRRRPTVDDISVRSKYEDIAQRIDAAIESGDLDRMDAMANKIKDMRKSGLQTTGEFGAENLAFKILRNNGTLERLKQARLSVKDKSMSVDEAKKKRRSKKYGYFGGMWFPGYGYYDSDASADSGGGDGGGGESVKENKSAMDIDTMIQDFVKFAATRLGLEKTPSIRIKKDPAWATRNNTFGRYRPEEDTLYVSVANRHPLDIMRTMAHELTHHRQNEVEPMPDHAGDTGSKYENEANAMAGIIMRQYADLHPETFGKALTENDEEDEEGKMPGTPIPFPKGTVKVDVSDTYDWYKLGQDISDLDDADPKDYGQGPPQTILSFGSEELEHKYIQDLARLGLDTVDLDEDLRSQLGAVIAAACVAGAPGCASTGSGSPAGTAIDTARTVYNLKNITRAGTEEELRQELKNYLRAQKGDPQAQNQSHLYKLQKKQQQKPPQQPQQENIQAPVSKTEKDREDYFKFVMAKHRLNKPLTRQEQDFIRTYQLYKTTQKKLAEASGYIPTEKERNDPRFKMALTVDVHPGQTGKEANKLGLQTDAQGRPQLLMKRLNNLLEAVKLDEKCWDGYSQQGMKKKGDRMVPNCVPVSEDEEDLMEVKMSPSALEAWARSPEAEGIRAGFEAEMIFRDTKRDEDEDEMEPDYDADERAYSIQQVIEFFSNDDWGYGLSGRQIRSLENELDESYMNWRDEKVMEDFANEAEDLVREIHLDEVPLSERIIRVLTDGMEIDDAQADKILAVGVDAPKFTKSSEQQAYADENPDYKIYLEALDDAEAILDEEVETSIKKQDGYYDQALDDYRDNWSGDDDSFFSDVGMRWMSDVANNFGLDWPYMSGESSGTGTRDWNDIGDSLHRAIDMPVKVSSNYHSTARRPGLWIIEPDGSLDPDDRDDEMGLEIVSPPMPLPETLEKLKQVIEWGNSEADAYTNSSTGLHMGISIPYVGGDVDYVKLVLFMGDEYILDKFGRASNNYAASAMEKLRNSMRVARRRGALTEAKFDPMGALELVQKNLIELAARYVQNEVGTSKYTSAHIQDGYIEFRSPGGDYLSMESRGEYDDIKNTMLRFARAMQIAGSPSLERREYAKKLYKLISPGAQDDGLKLFSQFAAGTITPEELKKQWAEAVLQKEIPTTGQEEWEVYDMEKQGPDSVIDSFYADEYDTAYAQAQQKYGDTPEWRRLDIRKKQPWFDVMDSYGDIILTVRARDYDHAKEKVQAEYGDRLSDDWRVVERPDGKAKEPEKKLSRRAQVAKRIKEPKVSPEVAADNAQDSKDLQARIGEPQQAGSVRDTGYYRVTWDERRNGEVRSDSLNIDSASAETAREHVLNALQSQGRDVVQISAHPQQPPAWRRNREPVPASTQGEFSGQWQVRNANTGEVVYTFSGIGNNQGDANRVAQRWVTSSRYDDPVEVVPIMRENTVNEVQILNKVKGKGEQPSNLPKFGRPIKPEEEVKYLGRQVGRMGRYEIWRDFLGGQVSYILLDPDERRALIHVFGSRYARNPDSLIIAGVYAAPNNAVRASQFYHALIKELGLTLISDNKQSPGGYKVWRELGQRFRDVNIYGYDTKRNKVLNVTADDEEMTHVPSSSLKGSTRDIQDTAYNIRLVATSK
jgi:hypothetical protein